MQIRAAREAEYKRLYKCMKRDFPPGELPPFFAVSGNLKRGAHEAVFIDEDQEVGYAVVTPPPDMPFALIYFFAMHPQVRGRGHGTSALKALAQRYPGRTLVLEVEDPAAAKDEEAREVRTRRLEFYTRTGFGIVPTERARIFGVDMLIMAADPSAIKSARETMHALYRPTFSSDKWLKFIDVADI